MSANAIYDTVCKRTKKAFGFSVHPHRFRHAAGTLWSIEDPANVRGVKDLLGHASYQKTTEAHYIMGKSLFAYEVTVLHAPRDLLLAGVLAATCLSAITIPLSGHVSDLIGRKKMYIIGAATMGVFGFVYFGLIDTGSSVLIFIAMMLSLIPHDMQYGPQAALIAESFTPRLRYSGASIGYQLASITAGGPAPLIATALFAAYKSGTPIAIYILVTAVISITATMFLKDYTGKDVSVEYDH
jgi:MFS family permease